VNPSDAVNVAQLQAATAGFGSASQAYTDQQVSNLRAYTDRELERTRRNADGGTALALAATGLRYEDRPGKVSLSGATSYYHDQMGIAMGLGATSESGRFRFNAALTASPTMPDPDIGAVVGASVSLN
jgi:trimeric autotransporter adhesin